MKDKAGFNTLSPYRSGFSNPNQEQQLMILRAKCKKVTELQEKVQLVLKHNSQLLLENQKLSKLLHQQKSDYQIIKNKYDMLNIQRTGYSSNQEYQIKKLLNQNQRLKNEILQMQGLKTTQLTDARNQLHIELQNLKRQQMANTEMYELQIRKLKDLLERKDYELQDNKNRINRAYNDTQYQIVKLREEKQRLKNQLMISEGEKKRDSQTIRNKLQMYYLTEIQALKKNHLANLQTLQFENVRLKDSLSTKNQQIQSLLVKQQKLKQNYEQTNNLLRNENESYRHKLIQFQRIGQVQFESLKQKLQDLHESQINILKHNNQNYVQCLQQEIEKLENIINNKNLQIQQLIKQKTQTRQLNQGDQNRLKIQIQNLLNKINEQDKSYNNNIYQMNKKIEEKQNHLDYLNNLNQTQNSKYSKQIQSLKKIIDHKKQQIQTKSNTNKQIQTHLKEQVSNQTKQIQNLIQALQKSENARTTQVQDLRDKYQLNINQLKEKLQGLNNKNALMKKQSDSLKQNINLRQKQINLLKKRLQGADQNQRKYSKQLDDFRTKLLNKDKQNNKIVQQQRNRLQKTFNYHLESLKGDHANNIKSQKIKISQLQNQIKKKQIDYQELLRRYKSMEEGLSQLTHQQSNKKDLTLKYPGATAQVIATKNLFDVFIKSKVLDITKRDSYY